MRKHERLSDADAACEKAAGDLALKIIELLNEQHIDEQHRFKIHFYALTNAIVCVVGGLVCEHCQRQTARFLKRTPWLELFADAKAHYDAERRTALN
jgi:hypothetical protein